MKYLTTLLTAALLIAASVAGAQSIPCPPGENCPGTCNFSITLTYPPSMDACGGTGYSSVTVTMVYGVDSGGESTECAADIDRSAGGGGITYTTCDFPHGGGETCTLNEDNFPDGQAWPPFTPNNPAPPGKTEISNGCAAHIGFSNVTQNGMSGVAYSFANVTSVDVDISMIATCTCGDSTTVDTISLDENTPVEHTHCDDPECPLDPNDPGVHKRNTRLGEDALVTQHDAEVNILSVGPNPFDDVITLEMEAPEMQKIRMIVMDQAGHKLYLNVRGIQSGVSTQQLHFQEELAAGIYYLMIFDQYNRQSTIKLLKR